MTSLERKREYNRRISRAFYERHKDDPEYREYRRKLDRAYRERLTPEQKDRQRQQKLAHYHRVSHTDEYKEARRIRNRRNRLRRYGITPEQYDEMLEMQDGVCAICEEPPVEGSVLAVDHNHDTGAVRGLLHRGCNSMLGWFEKNRERTEKYLDRP